MNCFYLLIYFNSISAELSLNYISEITDLVINDDINSKETAFNPIFGFFADKLGLINNIRFFSPSLQTFFKPKENTRQYIQDYSDDPLTLAIIKLFPSSSGVLSASTTAISNPLAIFSKDLHEMVRFFSRLYIAVLNNEIDFKFNLTQSENFLNKKKLFNKIKKFILEKSSVPFFQDNTIKLLLIHSYIINALDPQPVVNLKEPVDFSEESKNVNYFKLYLELIYKEIPILKNNPHLKIKIKKEILEIATNYYKSLNFFPYSIFNQPQSNKSIPIFYRKNNYYSKTESFSDCADVSLLHICNCLFFKDGIFDISHLPNSSQDLKNFYSKYKNIFELTYEIRNNWSRVIQDLDFDPEVFEKSPYPINKILYVSNRNEVKSGIVNMMNVLMTITGINKNEYFADLNAKNLADRLESLLLRLSHHTEYFKRNLGVYLNITTSDFFEFSTQIDNKLDFTGNFKIEFEYKMEDKAEIEIQQMSCHANVLLSRSQCGKEFKIDSKRMKETLQENNLLTNMIRNFLFKKPTTDPDYDHYERYIPAIPSQPKEFLSEVFLIGKLCCDQSKKDLLTGICKGIEKSGNSEPEIKKYLFNIGKAIVDTLELNDEGTIETFQAFLFWRPGVIVEDGAQLLNCFEAAKRTMITFVKEQWMEILQGKFPYVTTFQNFPQVFGFNIHARIFMIENLKFFKKLKILNISDLELDSQIASEIIEIAKDLPELEELDIGNNKIKVLPSEISNLKTLKKLHMGELPFSEFPVSFESLDRLEELTLEKNLNFSLKFPSYFKNFVNLKKLTLVNMGISKIPEFLLELKNLKELDLSENNLTSLPRSMENILKNLDFLNLKRNDNFIFETADNSIGMKELEILLGEKLNNKNQGNY